MSAEPRSPARQLVPFAALSASYFAHIGFFNPYLSLWLKDLGLAVWLIGLMLSAQSLTRTFAPYVWGWLSDQRGQRWGRREASHRHTARDAATHAP